MQTFQVLTVKFSFGNLIADLAPVAYTYRVHPGGRRWITRSLLTRASTDPVSCYSVLHPSCPFCQQYKTWWCQSPFQVRWYSHPFLFWRQLNLVALSLSACSLVSSCPGCSTRRQGLDLIIIINKNKHLYSAIYLVA